jgi:hypothetical protein
MEENMEDIHADAAREARRLLAAAFETVPAGPATVGDGLLRAVGCRYARRRRTRALLSAGAIAAAATGTAAAVLLSVTVAGAPPALAAVTGALSRAAAESYHMDLMVTERNTGPGGADPPLHITGDLDLERSLGKETMSNGWRTLIVGGNAYTYLPPAQARKAYQKKPWGVDSVWMAQQLDSPYPSTGAQLAWDFDSEWPFRPQALLAVLKTGTKVLDQGPVAGPGWTGTRYKFSLSHPAGTGGTVDSITCTVDTDSHGHIRSLVQTTAFVSGKPGTPGEDIYTAHFTFSHFGIRFSVTPPPASQVDPDTGSGIEF